LNQSEFLLISVAEKAGKTGPKWLFPKAIKDANIGHNLRIEHTMEFTFEKYSLFSFYRVLSIKTPLYGHMLMCLQFDADHFNARIMSEMYIPGTSIT
jgi:hypothetical protein